MAYPVPRFSTPKTPQHFEQTLDDNPRENKSRSNDTMVHYRRYLLGVVTVFLLVVWMNFSRSSPRQTDKVPFTHDSIKE